MVRLIDFVVILVVCFAAVVTDFGNDTGDCVIPENMNMYQLETFSYSQNINVNDHFQLAFHDRCPLGSGRHRVKKLIA